MDENDINTPPAEVDANTPIVDSSVAYPRGLYSLRCIGQKAKTSQTSGNPMIELQWEIVAPQVKRVGKQMYSIAGLQTTNYLMLHAEARGNANKFLKKVGMLEGFNYDVETTDPTVFNGLIVEAIAGSKLKEQMGEEYDDEGKKKAVKLIDPVTGKPMTTWQFGFMLTDVNRRRSADEIEGMPAF